MKPPLYVFIVAEESMTPGYVPGDHVVVFAWSRVRVGDVVVFNLGGQRHIKRITWVKDNLVKVEGDNRTKSARYQPLAKKQIVGKVLFKY